MKPKRSKALSWPLYDTAKRALAEATRIDEVKDVLDKAAAVQEYARRAKDATLITYATELRMDAERRAGQILIEMAARHERDTRGGNRKSKSQAATLISPKKLSELGVTKSQSSRWQESARISDPAHKANVKRASTAAYDRMTGRFRKEAAIERAKQRHASIIEHGGTVDDLVALAASGKRFSLIYADPAWPWETWSPAGKVFSSPDNYYGTSSIDAIMKLPVAALAAEDCALLLWCTGPHVTIGTHVKVMEAWGFKPSTIAFVWIKTKASTTVIKLDGDGLDWEGLRYGMGYATRSNSELCFLATKGSPLRLAEDVDQIVLAPRGKHSEKPEEVARRIERLYPGPYLELFARKPRDCWTVWGNEIPANKTR